MFLMALKGEFFMNVIQEYCRWTEKALKDADLQTELNAISGQTREIEDRFYRNLEFGTGGLRGVIGAGSNRMNVYTVAKATQGYSDYLNDQFAAPSVAIAYDSRIKSQLFAETAAAVFATNGIRVHLYAELMPTPSLSFAVRHLHCSGGIVITASHNPAKYNGYKVYGADGCQITLEAAKRILKKIDATDVFAGVRDSNFKEGVKQGLIQYIGEETVTAYLDAVSTQAIRKAGLTRDVSIVYTPLNGAGLKCVTRCLRENGFGRITVVESQREPDGNFPTCPYPNPEIREALEEGLKCARQVGSDLLLATDPDCDRVGVAVRHGGDYALISGNEMGILLFDYVCKSRTELGCMPDHPVAVKTIVTTDMLFPIAKHYGVDVIEVLTGFKFIGEQIGVLEQQGRERDYILGFEESYGYLSGGYVRDKDAVNASLLICEMFAYYKAQGKSLVDVLNGLYKTYGVYRDFLEAFTFEGAAGFETMQNIMCNFRAAPPREVAGRRLLAVTDYQRLTRSVLGGVEERLSLPAADVLKYEFEGDSAVIMRPSGTEPKLKLYYSIKAPTHMAAEQFGEALSLSFSKRIGGVDHTYMIF